MTNSKEHKAYFVGGVNGVGKSTFLHELTSKHPEFRVVKGSSMFMDRLGISQGDYDSLRALPEDYKKEESDKMMKELLSEAPSDDKTLLIDAHYFNYKRGQMVDASGEWMSLLDALFVISGDIDEVSKRILEDKKDRDLFPESFSEKQKKELLGKYLSGTIQKAREISEKYGVPFFIINNESGKIDDTIKSFLSTHNSVVKK